MAILNGLPVSIEVNGNSLDEYRDHDNQEVRLDSISKYIESFFSAAFAIRVSIPKIFSFTSDALGVFLYLDGTYVESGIFEKGLHDYRFKGTFGVGEGGLGYKEFTLNEIKLEDSSSSKAKDPATSVLADLGTIAVQVFRMRIIGPRIREGANRSVALDFRDELQVSEEELRGRSVTHSAKLGYKGPADSGPILTVYHGLGGFRPSAGRDAMRTEYVDGETSPLAVLKLNYRSRRPLQGLLLVSRTPTSSRSSTYVALKGRPFEELNAAEKDELVRRQQARYRIEHESRVNAESGVKIERGIKRECDEEYEELMASASAKKVKGPIANGETVEISDED